MLGMDRAYVIKHKWHHEGLSIRQIAGDLEVSRNTVRKYLYGEGEPRRRESDKRPQPVLDEVRERIDEILQEWGRRTTIAATRLPFWTATCAPSSAAKRRILDHSLTDRIKVCNKHLPRPVDPSTPYGESHPVESIQSHGVQQVALCPRSLSPIGDGQRVRIHSMMKLLYWIRSGGAQRHHGTESRPPAAREMTTTGRFLTISGALKPLLKSHIRSVPGFGWKVSMKVFQIVNDSRWRTMAVRLSFCRCLFPADCRVARSSSAAA